MQPDHHHWNDDLVDVQHHITPRKVYYAIFGSLLALTAITVWIAFIDLGVFNTPVALGIAGLKASLVILYFMHVRFSTRLTWVVIAASILWLAVLFVLTLADYISRGWSLL
jgi:cytochrome c oxidase subunit 4